MSDKDTSFGNKTRAIHCDGKVISFDTPKVMAVLNLTPDSFYDGGKHMGGGKYLAKVEQFLNEGADIIDIGAVSTRPGAKPVSAGEEIKRISGPLSQLVKSFPDAIFSIDTYRAEVAHECIALGAHIINDISGGTFDSMMFSTVATLEVPYILMHIHGTPENMQKNPIDIGIVTAVRSFFEIQVMKLKLLGVEDIILDPGFGFGKTLECNYALLKHLEKLRIENLPVLAGISRKSMINKVLGTKPEEALNGTTVLNTVALVNGASILRVHDVKAAVDAVKIVEYYKESGECD